jgi:hypothetical protein
MPSPFERRQALLTVRSARPNRSLAAKGKGVKGELPAGCQPFWVSPRRPLLRTFFNRTNSVSTAVLFWTARRWGSGRQNCCLAAIAAVAATPPTWHPS